MNPDPKPAKRVKKPPKPLKRTPIKKKVSDSQAAFIVKAKDFSLQYRSNHPTGRCFECDLEIPFMVGMNVCHLWSGGASPKQAYLDTSNVVLACVVCHVNYENGKDTLETKISELAKEVIPILKIKYKRYENK